MNMARDVIIFLVVLLGLFAANGWRTSDRAEHSTEYITSKTPYPDRNINVLFIGNSYTYTNDLPAMMLNIVSADAGNHVQVSVQAAVKSEATLSELWKSSAVHTIMDSRHWDYVVLQEQGLWASDTKTIQSSTEAVENFVNAIQQNHGKAVLYMTWMRAPGSSWYTDPKYAAALSSPEHMQARLHYFTSRMASTLQADVVPVGDCWAMALKNQPGLPFYQQDGSHPAPEGTYLAALMFYHYFTGRDVQYSEYMPENADEADVRFIRSTIPLCQALETP